MAQNNFRFPRIMAGKNIVVEATADEYRVSTRPTPANIYQGYFLVRPYPSYSPGNPTMALQVVDGALPYDESMTEYAGYVSIDRLHWISEDDGGPGIGSRRFRIPVPNITSLSVLDGSNIVFLKITAHSGGSDERLKFKEAHNRTVFFMSDYLIAPQVPELKEGVIYFPLAKVERYNSETLVITQLNSGEPSGTIMNYYGSDTLDLSDPE